ncbi:MAG: YceI family protein [Bacteroidetes bacterium]|nr:YceI family protein [Bacteroidota bacterium]
MKKTTLILYILFVTTIVAKSQIYKSKSCEISFFSSSPLENIEAKNKVAVPIMNTATGDFQVRIPIVSFKFEKPLMEEHFNENYMETDKFPYAIFKGKISETIDYTKDGEHKVTVKGNLEIHGVTKERTIDGTLTIKGGEITVVSKFNVHIADHNVKVPSLYVKNIAEDVEVKINSTLEPFKK